MEAEGLEQLRAEVIHLKAKLGCAEEENLALSNRLEAFQQRMEEIISEKNRQTEILTKEHVGLIQEVGRLHMESRNLREVAMRLQQENNELKARKEAGVFAELESAPPKRK